MTEIIKMEEVKVVQPLISSNKDESTSEFGKLVFKDIINKDWEQALKRIESTAKDFQDFSCRDLSKSKWNILQNACNIDDENKATETVRRILGMLQSFEPDLDRHDSFINNLDSENRTALHIAVEKKHQQVVEDLLLHRADVNLVADNQLKDALSQIYNRLHKVMVKLFDRDLTVTKGKFDPSIDQLWTIKCDFTSLTGIITKNEEEKLKLCETRLLATVLAQERVKRKDILLHPLVQIFLHLKGKKYRWFIYASVIYHIIWSLLCTCYFVKLPKLLKYGPSNSPHSLLSWLVYIFLVISFAKEAIEWKFSPINRYYWKQYENIGQWASILLVFFVTVFSFFEILNPATNQMSMIGVITALLLIQGQSTKIELLGIYNQMLIRSFKKFLRFLLAFSPMLLAFMYTFSLLLPESPAFHLNWGLAFIKTMVMMTGEINYDAVFHPEKPVDLPNPELAKLLFLLFVILVIVLLQNMLISITVADYEKLKKKCRTSHLATRLEVIFLIERFLKSFPRTSKFMEKFMVGSTKKSPTFEVPLTDLPNNIQKEILAYVCMKREN